MVHIQKNKHTFACVHTHPYSPNEPMVRNMHSAMNSLRADTLVSLLVIFAPCIRCGVLEVCVVDQFGFPNSRCCC